MSGGKMLTGMNGVTGCSTGVWSEQGAEYVRKSLELHFHDCYFLCMQEGWEFR